jgi:hypothetical protein
MGEVDQHLKALANNVMALFALDAGHQAHAACIVFITRVVEALGLRVTVPLIRYLHGYLLMNKIGFAFSVVRNGKDTWSEAFTNRKAPGQLWLDPSWQALHVGIVLNYLLYLNFSGTTPEIRHGRVGARL